MPWAGAIRLNTGMLAFAHGSGHVAAFHFAGLVNPASNYAAGLAGLVIIGTWLATVLPRRITYRMLFCGPVVRSEVPGLQVSYEGAEVGDPHVMELEVAYRGHRDLRASSFEKDRPFRIDVGAPVVGLIESRFRRDGELRVEASGRELRFGPGLVHRGESVRLVILLDGSGGRLSHKDRPADVCVRQRRPPRDRHPFQFGMLSTVITWGIVIFVIYYLVADPAGAADVLHGVFNGLRSVGVSLSGFVNSL
jgi:hypothetical protein